MSVRKKYLVGVFEERFYEFLALSRLADRICCVAGWLIASFQPMQESGYKAGVDHRLSWLEILRVQVKGVLRMTCPTVLKYGQRHE